MAVTPHLSRLKSYSFLLLMSTMSSLFLQDQTPRGTGKAANAGASNRCWAIGAEQAECFERKVMRMAHGPT